MKVNRLKTCFLDFLKIVNELAILGEEVGSKQQIRKLLRSLPKQWESIRVAIQESKNLMVLTIEELLGSLMTYEIDLTDQNISQKKTVAFTSNHSESDSDNSSENDEEYNLYMKHAHKKWFAKKAKQNSNSNKKPLCFECNKTGHLKTDCPRLKRAENFKNKKAMKATWSDSENLEADDCGLIGFESEEEVNTELSQDLFDELESEYFKLARKYAKAQVKLEN